jgi:CO/xanthine dehydrogenase Mo-binding subunit
MHRLVPVNRPLPTYMRTPGDAPGSFALESALDELAGAVKLELLELRLRNFTEIDPHEGKPFSSKSLRQCYAAGAQAFGWERRPLTPRSMRDGNELIGWGWPPQPGRQAGRTRACASCSPRTATSPCSAARTTSAPAPTRSPSR